MPSKTMSPIESKAFRNVSWNKSNNVFRGHKGKIISSAKTAEQCAKRLNRRCKNAGVELPNPETGFENHPVRRKSRKRKRGVRKRSIMQKKRKKVKIETNSRSIPIAFPYAMVGTEYAKLQCTAFISNELEVTKSETSSP